jgi:hypothetical protein
MAGAGSLPKNDLNNASWESTARLAVSGALPTAREKLELPMRLPPRVAGAAWSLISRSSTRGTGRLVATSNTMSIACSVGGQVARAV